ncbi:MAG TPA: ATP-binding protein [Bryobacteraceae bacterium]
MRAETIRIGVEDASHTAEARRMARRVARDLGFDEDAAERVAIGVTEACTNILKHAQRGELLVSVDNDGSGLEMLALDRGPGMGNLEQCLRDGFSTGGSPGQGLGAIMRLSAASDFYSIPGGGVATFARWSAAPVNGSERKHRRVRIGAVNVSKRGESVCGDAWGVEETEQITTVMVADGLGHGPDARAASVEAVRMLHLNPGLGALELLERSHRALRSSRGAAVAVARIDHEQNKVSFAGLGNISAHIYSGAKIDQRLVSVNGTAGHEAHRLHEFKYNWPANGMLVMHSDGLSTTASVESRSGLALRDPSVIAGVLYRDFSRGTDDATVVVAKTA